MIKFKSLRDSQYGVITESFENPYKFSLKKSNSGDYEAQFKADDGSLVKLLIVSDIHPEDRTELWNLAFYRNGKYSITGEGGAMRIFATLIAVLKEFIKKENPKYIEFFVPKAYVDSTKSKLYTRLVNRFAGKMGYSSEESTAPRTGSKTWMMTRK